MSKGVEVRDGPGNDRSQVVTEDGFMAKEAGAGEEG